MIDNALSNVENINNDDIEKLSIKDLIKNDF